MTLKAVVQAGCLVLATVVAPFGSAYAQKEADAKGGSGKADTGRLPRGNMSEVDKGKADAPKRKRRRPRACFLDRMSSPGGPALFGPKGRFFYFLASNGVMEGKKRQRKLTKYDYVLYRIDLKDFSSEPVLSYSHLRHVSLLLHGSPRRTASSYAFVGPRAGCAAGPAGVIRVAFKNDDSKAIRDRGRYVLVETPSGPAHVHQKKGFLLQLDPDTFQTRTRLKLGSSGRPLFVDPGKKTWVKWHGGSTRSLVAYEKGKAKRKLPVKKGTRVIQEGGRFALANLDRENNAIGIQEIPAWTGAGAKKESFTLKIPPAYTILTSGMDVDFDNRLALIRGANALAKSRWQRVFIFDYEKEKQLTVATATGDHYFNYTAITPDGGSVILEIRSQKSEETLALKVYDVASGKFQDVELEKPDQ